MAHLSKERGWDAPHFVAHLGLVLPHSKHHKQGWERTPIATHASMLVRWTFTNRTKEYRGLWPDGIPMLSSDHAAQEAVSALRVAIVCDACIDSRSSSINDLTTSAQSTVVMSVTSWPRDGKSAKFNFDGIHEKRH